MKKILITGKDSYIGTSVEAWLNRWPGRYQADTLDMRTDAWREADFSSYDVVYHVAGIAHSEVGKATEEQKKLYYKVNTDLAVETAKKARAEGVKQFIFMSSMIVYGGRERITKDTKPHPANFYGDSKWRADKGVRRLETAQFKVVVLRPPMIYGKGSKGNYPTLAKLAKRLPVFPKVNNKRSMLYIENLCEFVRLMIENEERGIFFPQNETYVNTAHMVKTIAKMNRHPILITGVLSPAVWIGKRIPGKIGNLCRKAFGDSRYELKMSEYRENYRVKDFEAGLLEIEKTF